MNRFSASATLACALALSLPAAAGATPVPKVSGPLPVSATSYPFGAADHQQVPQNLRKIGYVENEYVASGKAKRLQLAGAGSRRRAHTERAVHHARASCAARRRPRTSAAT